MASRKAVGESLRMSNTSGSACGFSAVLLLFVQLEAVPSLLRFPAMRSIVLKRPQGTAASHDRSGHAIACLWIERLYKRELEQTLHPP